MSTASYTSHRGLDTIISAALDRADSAAIVERCLRLDGDTLTVTTEAAAQSFDLSDIDGLLVLGVGKAAARMARALEGLLGDRISGGVVVTKYGHGEPLERLELVEAAHPVPDEAGVAGARRMEELLRGADTRTLVLTLVSGGGSALLVSPFRDEAHELGLDDLQQVTRLLLACGATIQEINCLRKHLSSVKGGRLARMISPAQSLNLILSDVVGDDPASVASGITAPDPSTYAQALEIARRYEVLDAFPAPARRIIEDGAAGRIAETPKPGDTVFERVHNVVIGSNTQALLAAAAASRDAGYRTLVLTARLVGEAREIAQLFPAIARDIRDTSMLAAPPACVLAGGETTVTIRDQSGTGGRNQELVLAALQAFTAAPEAAAGVVFASVATDGNDGPTDAAGGYLDADIARAAAAQPSDLEDALSRNDAYHYLDRLGALIRTGPTNTNVCDIQVLIVE